MNSLNKVYNENNVITSVIDWGSFSDIEKFYDFFYKNATIYLERKKKTFEVAVSISNSKIKYRKKQ